MPNRSKLSFLVVDDDKQAAEATANILDPYVTHIVTDPAQALQQYQQHKPDIVLLEISADGSGFEVLEYIQSFDPHAFIVILTTSRMDKDVQTTMRAGVAGYIPKPFRAHHVDECIAEYQYFKNKRKAKETDTVT
jgi:DNA-binding NarL/FixJ family response regulator